MSNETFIVHSDNTIKLKMDEKDIYETHMDEAGVVSFTEKGLHRPYYPLSPEAIQAWEIGDEVVEGVDFKLDHNYPMGYSLGQEQYANIQQMHYGTAAVPIVKDKTEEGWLITLQVLRTMMQKAKLNAGVAKCDELIASLETDSTAYPLPAQGRKEDVPEDYGSAHFAAETYAMSEFNHHHDCEKHMIAYNGYMAGTKFIPLPSQSLEERWVSVKDRLPECSLRGDREQYFYSEYVLVSRDGKEFDPILCLYDGKAKRFFYASSETSPALAFEIKFWKPVNRPDHIAGPQSTAPQYGLPPASAMLKDAMFMYGGNSDDEKAWFKLGVETAFEWLGKNALDPVAIAEAAWEAASEYIHSGRNPMNEDYYKQQYLNSLKDKL